MKLTDDVFYYTEMGPFDCNTYVVRGEVSVIIDPGLEQYLPRLVKAMLKDGIDPKDIGIVTNTHLHADHYSADRAFSNLSGARVLLHPLHREFYDTTVVEVSKYFGAKETHLQEDGYLDSSIETGRLQFELLPSPGHSPDSICFYCKSEQMMICGDVLFQGNTGRVDIPGGSGDQLKQSIEALSHLNTTYLLPGHMGFVSGVEAVKRNFKFVTTSVFPWL